MLVTPSCDIVTVNIGIEVTHEDNLVPIGKPVVDEEAKVLKGALSGISVVITEIMITLLLHKCSRRTRGRWFTTTIKGNKFYFNIIFSVKGGGAPPT